MICLSSVLNSVRKNRDFVSREHEKRPPNVRKDGLAEQSAPFLACSVVVGAVSGVL